MSTTTKKAAALREIGRLADGAFLHKDAVRKSAALDDETIESLVADGLLKKSFFRGGGFDLTKPSARFTILADKLVAKTATLSPSAVAYAEKWASGLSDEQRKLAGALAQRLRTDGFSIGMSRDFQKVGMTQFDMETPLKIAQMPNEQVDQVREQTIALLEIGAAGNDTRNAASQPELPRRAGQSVTFEAHGKKLIVKRTQSGSWHLKIDGTRSHSRFADSIQDARSDVKHFMQVGSLPRGSGGPA